MNDNELVAMMQASIRIGELQKQLNAVTAERDALKAQLEIMTAERDELKVDLENAELSRDEAIRDIGRLDRY